MKSNRKGFVHLVILLVVAGGILIAGARWYHLQERNRIRGIVTETLQKNAAVQATSTVQKTDVDTSNWKAYRNEEYGFSVKWPWEVAQSGSEVDFFDEKGFPYITMRLSQEPFETYCDVSGCKERAVRGKDITIVEKYTADAMAVAEVIAGDGDYYQFYLRHLSPEASALFDAFLSTLGIDAVWQTYRNEEYGFEVKYPLEWKVSVYNTDLGNAADFEVHIAPENSQSYFAINPRRQSGCGIDYEVEQSKSVMIDKFTAKREDFFAGSSHLSTNVHLREVEDLPNFTIFYCVNDESVERIFEKILSTFKFVGE